MALQLLVHQLLLFCEHGRHHPNHLDECVFLDGSGYELLYPFLRGVVFACPVAVLVQDVSQVVLELQVAQVRSVGSDVDVDEVLQGA